jgi:hypothetical protein
MTVRVLRGKKIKPHGKKNKTLWKKIKPCGKNKIELWGGCIV